MNLRFEILRAVSKNPGAPIAEIVDVIKHDRQKTTWSVRDCAKEGLLSMRRDDVTGQPGYTLTAAGKQRLAEGPGRKQSRSTSVKEPQPAVGNNAGSSASALPSPPAEGAAVQPEPAPAAATSLSAAPVAVDDQSATDKKSLSAPPPEYDPRSVSFNAAARADAAQDENYSLLGVLADIRAAVGDPEGRLMEDELVDRVRTQFKSAAAANADLDKIRDVLGQRIHIGDPGRFAAPVKCAELAASLIDSLLGAQQDDLNMIAIASETLAAVADGPVDTSDMDLDQLAKSIVQKLEAKDAELLEQARVVVALRDTITQRNAELRNAQALAEHLRKHAAQSGEQAESIEVGFLLEAVRDLLPDQTRITVPGGQSYVSICAFGHNFDVSPYEAENILGHISALAKYAEIPF